MGINIRRGQAVLEFAIFASFILLCLGVLLQLGMNANFSDDLRMTTFRRAVALAQQRGAMASRDNPNVSLSVIQDKFIPTPGRYFGAADTAQVGASSSILYSTRGSMKPDFDTANSNPQANPNMDLEVNTYRKNFTTGLFRAAVYSNDTMFWVLEELDNGPPWFQKSYVRGDAKDSNGNDYIRSGATIFEPVTAPDGSQVWIPIEIESVVRESGLIYAVLLDPIPADINNFYQYNDANGIPVGEGLQPTSVKQRDSTNTVNRDESPAGIASNGVINNKVTITRTITGARNETVTSTIQQNIP